MVMGIGRGRASHGAMGIKSFPLATSQLGIDNFYRHLKDSILRLKSVVDTVCWNFIDLSNNLCPN